MIKRVCKRNRPPYWWLMGLGCLSASVLAIAGRPLLAAERVYVSYSILERSISIRALEEFAKTGRITENLQAYTRYLKPDQLRQFREGLQQAIDLKPVTLAQFLYTPLGEALLQRLTPVIRMKAGPSSFYALRAALILAAADPEGLTVLSALRHFPASGVQLDVSEALETWGQIQQLVQQTEAAVRALEQQAAAANSKPLLTQVLDPQLPGPYLWQKTTLTLVDQTQRRLELTGSPRKYLVDVYLPDLEPPQRRPVIVISHGLNSDRSSFAYLAEYLASYGFVVAVPEHPGSNTEQLIALVQGRANIVAQPQEFVDRPLDVSYLLDELDRLGQTDPRFRDRLNLKQVGVVGQSFGGYTALVLAGARLDLPQLQRTCPAALTTTLNLSLFLQCQAQGLPPRDYTLADSRVQAIVAVNPLNSVILGPAGLSQIKIPVMIVSGSADTVALTLPEQLEPFTWLTAPNKYLVLVEGATHLSMIGRSSLGPELLPTPPVLIGPAPNLARNYLEALSVAFLKTYVGNQPAYAAYLSNHYMQFLSRDPLTLSLVDQLMLPRASTRSRN